MCCDVTIKYHETSPLRVADQDYKKQKLYNSRYSRRWKEKAINISLGWTESLFRNIVKNLDLDDIKRIIHGVFV